MESTHPELVQMLEHSTMKSFSPTAQEVKAFREEQGISLPEALHRLRRRNMEVEIIMLSADETLTPNEERLLSLIYELVRHR
jgi:hypothetical protein